MDQTPVRNMRDLPAVDRVLSSAETTPLIERFGRSATLAAAREVLDRSRRQLKDHGGPVPSVGDIVEAIASRLAKEAQPQLRTVFNLTGTVLHTNLGRALLAEEAIEAAVAAMRSAMALELDLDSGKRGDRDDHVREIICQLTGAEDATVVNNNAAAVLISLNTLALDRDAVVSRGELIEIGGAFRMPDIMARAGCRLVEVGTTNRTHAADYRAVIGPDTGAILKVHTSNYRIQGFTAEVPARDLFVIAQETGVQLVNDLGSGTLMDLSRHGLNKEPTVREAVDAADLVTFSGDKLLGGPQTGFIVGRRELIARINRNPLKRAMRVDKIRLAAIEATLRLYRDPDRLVERLPTLRLLARPYAEIRTLAERLRPYIAAHLGQAFTVEVVECASQVGSGALPLETLPSAGLAITSHQAADLPSLVAVLRALDRPVIGRMEGGALRLDLRCLTDESGFLETIGAAKSRL